MKGAHILWIIFIRYMCLAVFHALTLCYACLENDAKVLRWIVSLCYSLKQPVFSEITLWIAVLWGDRATNVHQFEGVGHIKTWTTSNFSFSLQNLRGKKSKVPCCYNLVMCHQLSVAQFWESLGLQKCSWRLWVTSRQTVGLLPRCLIFINF